MSDVEAPITPVEHAIAKAWSEVIGIEPIGRGDRFSDLGGTSLGAEKTLIELRRALGRDLGADLFADDPTVAELAEAIDARCAEEFRGNAPTCTKLSDGPLTGGAGGAGDDDSATGIADAAPPPVFMFAGAGPPPSASCRSAPHCPAGAKAGRSTPTASTPGDWPTRRSAPTPAGTCATSGASSRPAP
ncbi:Linear gramicidin synthase subunit D [Corynebacterium hansenii]|nr:Linear gramicidin synthase subunit D [Corynebacterium hansenii]